jgi:hypothetical protein
MRVVCALSPPTSCPWKAKIDLDVRNRVPVGRGCPDRGKVLSLKKSAELKFGIKEREALN